MNALLRQEWRLARAGGSGVAVSLLFVFAVVAVTAFAIGADLPLLGQIGPAIIWLATLLAALLGNERLFAADLEDGTFDLILTSGTGASVYAAAKALAKWAFGLLPLVAITPLAGLLLAMSPAAIVGTTVTLAVGSVPLAALATLAAALSANARGAVLGPIVVMPLLVPVVVFGSSAAAAWGTPAFATPFLLLCAASLASALLVPLAVPPLLKAGD